MKNIYEVELDFTYLGNKILKGSFIEIIDMTKLIVVNKEIQNVFHLSAYIDPFIFETYDTIRFIFDNKKYLIRKTIR